LTGERSAELAPDTARWARICEIFDAVVDRPEQTWEEAVRREAAGDPGLYGEVMRILIAGRDDRFHLDHPLLVASPRDATPEGAERVGETVARYRLVRLIGCGGMGAVYEGIRAGTDYHHRVAVKLIRPRLAASGIAARFRRERQILAALEHRNIARLLDGGLTEEGEPFFVMEYVEGTPITTYSDHHRLPIAARLRLFLQACGAVQHAHGKLVVHRDIKPANVLVTVDGSVKLLDFGVATLLGAATRADDAPGTGPDTVTQFGARAFTPEYASPEQLRDEPVSTASDVYSLGVLLYELLTGTRPFDAPIRSASSALRAREGEPRRASSVVTADAARTRREASAARLAHSLSGELDNIVAKAIQPEPHRRYDSAEQFAADVRRYLDGLPVLAQPTSVVYRTRKFVRRNRSAVAAAAVAILALVGGTVATSLQARRANALASRAEIERDKAARINAFLQDMLSAPDTRSVSGGANGGAQVTVAAVLDGAARRAGVDLARTPKVEAAVRRTLGRTYTAIGEYDRASVQLERALALDRLIGAPPIPDLVTDLHDLGMARLRAEDVRAADTLFRATLDLCHAHDAAADSAHVCGQTINDLGLAALMEQKLPEAERLFQQALVLARRVLGPSHPVVGVVLGNLAVAHDWAGDLPGAERLYREALAVFAKSPREVAERTYTLENLGRMLAMEGRLAPAEQLMRQALRSASRTEGPRHPDAGFAWVCLGAVHRKMGQLALAARETERGLTVLGAAGASARHYWVTANIDRGLLLLALGQHRASLSILREVLDTARVEYAPGDFRLARARSALGRALAASGDAAEAIPLLEASHATFLHLYGPAHPETVRTEQLLAAAERRDEGALSR